MAERLGYRGHAGLARGRALHEALFPRRQGSRRADRHRLLGARDEAAEVAADPRHAACRPFGWRRRAKLRRTSDFRIENGRISPADKDVFAKDPVNFIRLFALADEHQASFSPEVLRQVRVEFAPDRRQSPRQSDRQPPVPAAPDRRARSEGVLRKMNEAGVLGRFIPDFGRVVSMMQFNMYHHFTVDEHLIRTIGFLSEHRARQVRDEHPVSTEIMRTIDNRRALYVAALLHDIAKGRDEDHSHRRRAHRARARPAARPRRRPRPRPRPGWSSIIW